MRSFAVIGAGFGDEGKGLMVDFLASQLVDQGREPVVVRHNGGCQAAHTVVTPEGTRHVFKHHGSGTLVDVDTHLSRDFVVNPIVFRMEREELTRKMEDYPFSLHSVGVDHGSLVTLPMDMILNQAAEISRGKDRHGSCGYGIGETVQRSLDPRLRVLAEDLKALDLPRLRWIRGNYLAQRMSELNLTSLPGRLFEAAMSDGVLESFLEDCRYFLERSYQEDDDDLYIEPLIYEGAQGLALDQRHPFFPHVTRSNTGLANVLRHAAGNGIKELEVIYVTRCYVTRHGAGPLPHEGKLSGVKVADETNVPNDWQGTLRLAPLDFDLLRENVMRDWQTYGGNLDFYPSVKRTFSLALTCLDQINGAVSVVRNGCVGYGTAQQIGAELRDTFPEVSTIYSSTGPTRETVRIHRAADSENAEPATELVLD